MHQQFIFNSRITTSYKRISLPILREEMHMQSLHQAVSIKTLIQKPLTITKSQIIN